MDCHYILAQAIGFGGAAMLIGAYQCKTSHRLFGMQICGHLLYIIHFFMLGALSGATTLFIALLRGVILFNAKKRWARSPLWLWLFIGLFVAGCFATWMDAFSLLPCAAMIVTTSAMWSTNGKKIRLANMFVSSPFWLVYDAHAGSWSGVLCELFAISSIMISIFRYGLKALDVDESAGNG